MRRCRRACRPPRPRHEPLPGRSQGYGGARRVTGADAAGRGAQPFGVRVPPAAGTCRPAFVLAGGWWLVAGGWWSVVGGRWSVAGVRSQRAKRARGGWLGSVAGGRKAPGGRAGPPRRRARARPQSGPDRCDDRLIRSGDVPAALRRERRRA
ncbi:hypothetical protein STPH2_5870 [Streptomyces sp. KO7888]|nr:hypothetical protein [Streptomyces sp. KO7888]